MIVPDLNVLIAAFRVDHVHHDVARDALRIALERGLAVPLVVIGGLVRITGRMFAGPDTTASAFAFADALLAHSRTRVVEDSRADVTRWRTLCVDLALSSTDITDAYLAAVAIERRATLLSFDRGFARFPGLRWIDPSDPAARERL